MYKYVNFGKTNASDPQLGFLDATTHGAHNVNGPILPEMFDKFAICILLSSGATPDRLYRFPVFTGQYLGFHPISGFNCEQANHEWRFAGGFQRIRYQVSLAMALTVQYVEQFTAWRRLSDNYNGFCHHRHRHRRRRHVHCCCHNHRLIDKLKITGSKTRY